jgi:hypothetical protein
MTAVFTYYFATRRVPRVSLDRPRAASEDMGPDDGGEGRHLMPGGW